MNILAIHDGHNCSAALFKNNKIEYAISEERFSKIKNQGGFPERAILAILSDAGLTADEIDHIVFCNISPIRPDWAVKELILERYKSYCEYKSNPIRDFQLKIEKLIPKQVLNMLRQTLRPTLYKKIENTQNQRKEWLTKLGLSFEKTKFIEHHICHAASVYYGICASEKPVLCFTCDGGGDGLCATVSVGEDGKLKRKSSIQVEESIAKLYALITFMMGFVPLEHEYKLMGLAPYADAKRVEKISHYLESLFCWDEKSLEWKRKKGLPPTSNWHGLIREKIQNQRFDIVAGGFQKFIENMITRWVKAWIKETGIRNIALSGGLFMNVKLNKLLMELEEVDSIDIMPSCSDESNVVGASYITAVEAGIDHLKLEKLKHLYLGVSYSEKELAEAVHAYQNKSSCNIVVTSPDDIENEIAKLLSEGNIVANYYGKEEFGARALGNRSILADPSKLELVKEINKMIKCRDFWMPFAGSMTEDQANQNLKNPKSVKASYMILAFDADSNYDHFHAATHPYDHTIRPQIVTRESNERYYKIIKKFEEITDKKGGVLNTSFNLHGYPIVSSPSDALSVFENSGLKYIALGDYLLTKKSALRRRI